MQKLEFQFIYRTETDDIHPRGSKSTAVANCESRVQEQGLTGAAWDFFLGWYVPVLDPGSV